MGLVRVMLLGVQGLQRAGQGCVGGNYYVLCCRQRWCGLLCPPMVYPDRLGLGVWALPSWESSGSGLVWDRACDDPLPTRLDTLRVVWGLAVPSWDSAWSQGAGGEHCPSSVPAAAVSLLTALPCHIPLAYGYGSYLQLHWGLCWRWQLAGNMLCCRVQGGRALPAPGEHSPCMHNCQMGQDLLAKATTTPVGAALQPSPHPHWCNPSWPEAPDSRNHWA